MNVIKCDNCNQEMTEGNDFYALNISSIGLFTNYSSHNHEQPPVRHFCNNECLSEWSANQFAITNRILDWVEKNK